MKQNKLYKTVVENQKIYTYTWNDFEEDCDIIVNQLKRLKHKIKYVYGPPRGGCIFAVKLSHKLRAKYLISLEEEHIPYNTLIVDDVSDTGATLIKLVSKGNYTTATAFVKPRTKYVPHIFCRSVENNTWIVYQWEV